MSYTSTCRLQETPSPVLVIHCSDHRFQLGLRQFLDEGLGLAGNYDVMIVPGGPQALLPMWFLPKFSWVTRKWLRFLVRAHSLNRVVLIAHQDCGWCKFLAEQEGINRDAQQWHKHDLGEAGRLLSKDFHDLAIELYFAAWDAEGRVIVDRMMA